MSVIDLQQVTKSFGDIVVLDNIDLQIEQGEVVVVVGPSGSGKSTLLRCINALERIDSGDLYVDGLSVLSSPRSLRAIRREAGMVFQQFNLFPQLSALDNVAFGPRHVRGMRLAAARRQAMSQLERVGLADRASHMPNQLSGGQQQRVAIARALAL
ncbi:MAG: ATP-binding cassette domain-containing protein, partial [Bifidobacteriaceae bacterium]|nr:ATP-binding cassette domain-containing protein [Bifidobacteriaceae bacterium]